MGTYHPQQHPWRAVLQDVTVGTRQLFQQKGFQVCQPNLELIPQWQLDILRKKEGSPEQLETCGNLVYCSSL